LWVPGGFIGVLLQRLHLTATRSSVSSTDGGGGGCAMLKNCVSLPGSGCPFERRGMSEIAS